MQSGLDLACVSYIYIYIKNVNEVKLKCKKNSVILSWANMEILVFQIREDKVKPNGNLINKLFKFYN